MNEQFPDMKITSDGTAVGTSVTVGDVELNNFITRVDVAIAVNLPNQMQVSFEFTPTEFVVSPVNCNLTLEQIERLETYLDRVRDVKGYPRTKK